ADLIAQAEHGSGHERVWLLTPSAKLITAVQREVAARVGSLSRFHFIQETMSRGAWLVQVPSMDRAVEIANSLAPEHCEVIARNARCIADRIMTAGAIFLGPWSPTAVGDYLAGPSHTLPTGGAGRSFGGLGADQFQRRTSIVEYNRAALAKSLQSLRVLAGIEGLHAHAHSAEIRLAKGNTRKSKS
ncbi:MAG: histidinol dehydrogenase, partial [Verrucomicrobiae bacterium]|nr:histidinol dehydrogenase [Verrucomicrobiae bacterium]